MRIDAAAAGTTRGTAQPDLSRDPWSSHPPRSGRSAVSADVGAALTCRASVQSQYSPRSPTALAWPPPQVSPGARRAAGFVVNLILLAGLGLQSVFLTASCHAQVLSSV